MGLGGNKEKAEVEDDKWKKETRQRVEMMQRMTGDWVEVLSCEDGNLEKTEVES